VGLAPGRLAELHAIAGATAIEVARVLPDVLLNGRRVEAHHHSDIFFFRKHVLTAVVQLQAELRPQQPVAIPA